MADVGVAQTGWRLKTPNMPPLKPVTSNVTSSLQFGQMCFLILPVDL